MHRNAPLPLLLAAALLGGCSIVDFGPLNDVIDASTQNPDMTRVDGPAPDLDEDMGVMSDFCGDDTAFVITETVAQLRVDTRELQNRETPTCAPSWRRWGTHSAPTTPTPRCCSSARTPGASTGSSRG